MCVRGYVHMAAVMVGVREEAGGRGCCEPLAWVLHLLQEAYC